MTPFQIKRIMLLSQMREYQTKEAVIRQGEIDDKLFIVIAGEADIILHEGSEREKVIAGLKAGDIFGEAGYAGNVERTATVRVAPQSQSLQLIMLNQQQIQSAMRFYPRLHAKLNHNICKILAQRLSERTQMKL